MTINQGRAEKYLMQIKNADREITEIILKISYLRYKASGGGAIRYDKDRVQTSPQDVMSETITEVVTLERKLSSRYKELMDARNHAEDVIQLWNDNQARFISIYYLDNGDISDVAEKIKCSNRTAYRIKLDALERFSKYL